MPGVRTTIQRPQRVTPFVGDSMPPDSALTFPATPLLHRAQIAPGAVLANNPNTWPWEEIPADSCILWDSGILTRRGTPDGSPTGTPSQCFFIAKNMTGDWTIDNPNGRWYGLLDQGTPFRYFINPGDRWHLRFTGQILALPTSRDKTGNYVVVSAEVGGPRRRSNIGTGRTQTAATVAAAVDTNLIAYWALRDAAGATSAASGVTGGSRATPNALVVFAAVPGPDGTTLYPSVEGGGELVGSIATTTVTNQFAFSAIVQADTAASVDNSVVGVGLASGTAPNWWVNYDSTGVIQILCEDADEVTNLVATASVNPFDGAWRTLYCTVAQNGSNVDAKLYIDGTLSASGTLASRTINRPTTCSLSFELNDDILSVGEVKVYSSALAPTATTTASSSGSSGQQAHVRFAALCDANNIFHISSMDASLPMGVQPAATLPNLLAESETVEDGVIVERRDFALTLHGREVRENAAVALQFAHGGDGQVLVDYASTFDDQLRVNNMTVNRPNGGTAQSVVSEPTRGTYENSKQVNVETDAMLPDQAEWRTHRGTYSGRRFPLLAINLARNPELIPDALEVDISSRIYITDPPSDLPPDPVDVLVEQIEEFSNSLQWTMRFATSPFAPWRIAVASADSGDTSDFLGHADWDTCVLAEDLDATETAVDVTTTPLITTTADSFPFYIRVGGEQMQATACAGASNPQTLTVVRSTNSITKTHTSGATVELDPISSGYASL